MKKNLKIIVVAAILTLILLPILKVLQEGFIIDLESWRGVIYRPFIYATQRSFKLLLWVALTGSVLGMLLGGVASAWKFPLKSLAFVLLSIPLIMPSFVTAIGIQSLQPFFSFATSKWLDGYWGSFWSGLAIILPIVSLGSYAAGLQISKSERELVQIYRGRFTLLIKSFLRVYPVSLACAVFGGILFLSDSGSGQIMGYHGISGDILVSFSAKNDFKAAAMKAIILITLFLPIAVSLYVWVKKKLNYSLLQTKQNLEELPEWKGGLSILLGTLFCCICLIPTVAIFSGLVRPLLGDVPTYYIEEAWALFLDSIGTTMFYGAVAAIVAVVFSSLLLSLCSRVQTQWLLMFSILSLSIPSCVSALGVVDLASLGTENLDWLLRSKFTVGLAMGIRYTPLAILIIIISGRRLQKSTVEVANLHGLFVCKKIWYIYLPNYSSQLLSAFVIVVLISLADVSSMTLLQPPGGASFGSHLFAVMDAASEKVVAGLCLVYVVVPLSVALLFSTYQIIRRRW